MEIATNNTNKSRDSNNNANKNGDLLTRRLRNIQISAETADVTSAAPTESVPMEITEESESPEPSMVSNSNVHANSVLLELLRHIAEQLKKAIDIMSTNVSNNHGY